MVGLWIYIWIFVWFFYGLMDLHLYNLYINGGFMDSGFPYKSI